MTRRPDRAVPIRILVTAWFLAGAIGIGALFRLAWTESHAARGPLAQPPHETLAR
jgi:hypothetical protein